MDFNNFVAQIRGGHRVVQCENEVDFFFFFLFFRRSAHAMPRLPPKTASASAMTTASVRPGLSAARKGYGGRWLRGRSATRFTTRIGIALATPQSTLSSKVKSKKQQITTITASRPARLTLSGLSRTAHAPIKATITATTLTVNWNCRNLAILS